MSARGGNDANHRQNDGARLSPAAAARQLPNGFSSVLRLCAAAGDSRDLRAGNHFGARNFVGVAGDARRINKQAKKVNPV
jgi:hypothetical protein